ncbi:MAG: hypothetical protein EOO56_21695 [Hymenobacter sp.]|nr:MAG: hypothetical protein EOO56_21695 [Hymenobacter sp.]
MASFSILACALIERLIFCQSSMNNGLLFALPLIAALAACSSNDAYSEATASSVAQQAVKAKLHIPVGNPVLIDSSDYVMYPLSLTEIVTEEKDEYGSSSYGRATTYWNVLFYNPRSKQSHLLTSQKLIISSYAGQNSENSSDSDGSRKAYLRASAADKLLYFSANSTDFNHDGRNNLLRPMEFLLSNARSSPTYPRPR